MLLRSDVQPNAKNPTSQSEGEEKKRRKQRWKKNIKKTKGLVHSLSSHRRLIASERKHESPAPSPSFPPASSPHGNSYLFHFSSFLLCHSQAGRAALTQQCRRFPDAKIPARTHWEATTANPAPSQNKTNTYSEIKAISASSCFTFLHAASNFP